MNKSILPKTVLIVEDDYSIRETLQEALEMNHYQVVSAENGREGLEKLHLLARPCLVLLDLMMPVMNGHQFLDAVSKDAIPAPIPVVVLSAVANERNTAGAVAFIRKPPDLDQLLETVDRYINLC